MSRAHLIRLAAPAAFLAAVTIAVLIVRGSIGGGTTAVVRPPPPPPTAPKPATVAPGKLKPGGLTGPLRKRFYTVQSGDTFEVIASKWKTTVEQIQTLNPGVDSTALQVGQKLRVG